MGIRKKEDKEALRRDHEPEAREERTLPPRFDEQGPESSEEEYSGSEIAVSDLRLPNEPDPREVDSVTDRIFASVLSRYGWERHHGRIEHVGEVHQPRR